MVDAAMQFFRVGCNDGGVLDKTRVGKQAWLLDKIERACAGPDCIAANTGDGIESLDEALDVPCQGINNKYQIVGANNSFTVAADLLLKVGVILGQV